MAIITVARDASRDALERRTREIGHELFARIGRGPSIWNRAWWDDRMMNLTLGDPLVKVQLFRFIDALPALSDDASVRRHLGDYLDEAGDWIPRWVNLCEDQPDGSQVEEKLLS